MTSVAGERANIYLAEIRGSLESIKDNPSMLRAAYVFSMSWLEAYFTEIGTRFYVRRFLADSGSKLVDAVVSYRNLGDNFKWPKSSKSSNSASFNLLLNKTPHGSISEVLDIYTREHIWGLVQEDFNRTPFNRPRNIDFLLTGIGGASCTEYYWEKVRVQLNFTTTMETRNQLDLLSIRRNQIVHSLDIRLTGNGVYPLKLHHVLLVLRVVSALIKIADFIYEHGCKFHSV